MKHSPEPSGGDPMTLAMENMRSHTASHSTRLKAKLRSRLNMM